jgi:hypothetical protein
MSKKVKFPNGFIGVASDAVAAKLAKKSGHEVLGDYKPDAESAKKPEPAKDAK